MNDTRSEFVAESREHLAVFERSMLSLEKAVSGDESRTLIQHGLRAVHSLKGDSGFLGYTAIRQLAHAMESLLEAYRDGARLPSTSIVEGLLAARDRLAALVEDPDHIPQTAVDEIIQRLAGLEVATAHAIPFDINLRRWLAFHGEIQLTELFRRLEAFGKVENPRLTGIPKASDFESATWALKCDVHFSGTLMTSASPDDVAELIRDVAAPLAGIQEPGVSETPGFSELLR